VTSGHHRVHVEGKNRLIRGNGGRIMGRWLSPSLILNSYAVKPKSCARKAQPLVEEAARLLAKSSALEKQGHFSRSVHTRHKRKMLNSGRQGIYPTMNVRLRPQVQRHQQRLQEIRWERKAETQQIERLSATLVTKVESSRPTLIIRRRRARPNSISSLAAKSSSHCGRWPRNSARRSSVVGQKSLRIPTRLDLSWHLPQDSVRLFYFRAEIT
jgi:hypothetical protein